MPNQRFLCFPDKINMKIVYVANSRIPTEKAHGIQIMKMCEAFAKLGHEVNLVIPRRFNPIVNDTFEYYKVKRIFKVTKLPVIDMVPLGRFGFIIELISFSISAFAYVLLKPKDSIVYSRDELPLLLISFFRKNIFWETHVGRLHAVAKSVARRAKGIVVISNGLKNLYLKSGIPDDKIIVAPDGVDFLQFAVPNSKEEARIKLWLPQDKNIIMYTGHLYYWKGARVLAEAARLLTDKELVVFVGGTERDIKSFREKTRNIKNILVLGKKPHADIPFYLKAADILVLPNSGKNEISAKYTSPMKLFEYMASGMLIVASDLPSIREILDNETAHFFRADDSGDLAKTLKSSLQDKGGGEKSSHALDLVKSYSWENRAKLILSFLNLSGLNKINSR